MLCFVSIKPRYDLAEDEFERAARLNNTEAKYRLGLLYCHRKIPNKHHADAIPLWKEAAQAGHLQAQYANFH
jgi:TPR repeat protein